MSHKVQVLLATAKRRDQKCRISERIWVIHKYLTHIIRSTDVFQDISTLPVVSWILLDCLGILGAFAKSEKTTVDS